MLAGLCRCILLTGLALTSWTMIPSVVGFDATTVMSGSMAPRFQVGDAVIARPASRADLSVGQVLLFDDPDDVGALRFHRLMQAKGDRLVTRGDANAANDSSAIGFSAVHGVGFLRIPHAGLPTYWVRTGQVRPLLICGAIAIALAWGTRLDRRFTVGRHIDESGDRRRRPGPRHRWVTATPIVLVIALCGTLVTHDAAPAAARFSTRTSNSQSSFAGCWDWPNRGTLPTSALAYFNYMETAGSTTVNRASPTTPVATFGTVVRGAGSCIVDGSPYISLGRNGASGLIAPTKSNAPSELTIATWFRTGTPSGTIADLGSDGTGGPSPAANLVLYMSSTGSVNFGVVTSSLLGIPLGGIGCQSPPGNADNTWHLVILTFSATAGCKIGIDGAAPLANTPAVSTTALSLQLLSDSSGYWRLGYDSIGGFWPNVGTNPVFTGDLDESQIYTSVLTTQQQAAIVARRH